MKELSIEEKAKRYDEAIERAKKINNEQQAQPFNIMTRVFPELKESEDERIRKELIAHFKTNSVSESWSGLNVKKVIAWLEKQGENSVCKVKIGETYKCIASPRYTCFRTGNIYHVEDNFVAELINLCSGCFMLLEKQGEQKPYGQREECLNCQFNYARECKGSCQMKRDEQKPTDKVEPKFKIGDIIIKSHNSDINKFGKFKITGIKDDRYWYNKFVICEISEQDEWELVRIESKFKVGDWVVSDYNSVAYIESISETKYNLQCKDGSHEKLSVDYINRCWHLWTIKDAKDGDVLIYNHQQYKWIFIFKRLYNPIIVSYYIMFTEKNKICIDDSISTNFLSKITPATKEQRDFLFTEMKEAGYEWNKDNKELKKVDEIEEPDFFDDFRNSDVEVDSNEDGLIAATIKYKNEQKPAWSEEDERIYQSIIDDTVQENQLDDRQINWLKSLKGRIRYESK